MRRKSGIFISLLLAAGLIAAACSAAAEPTAPPSGPAGPAGAPGVVPTPTPAPRTAAAAFDEASFSVKKSSLPGLPSVVTDRMIVRTANVSLLVEDVPETLESIARLVDRLDGTVVSSSMRGDGDESSAIVTIRVPVATFDDALADLRRLGVRVVSENTGSQDVTEEYVDLDAQLRNLEATETQYLNLLNRADTVEDVLKVQRELSSVRGQIERIKGRLQYLERTSAMSVITVHLSPATNPKPLVDPGWSASESSKAAVRSLTSAGQALADGLIRVLVFSPFWLPIVGVTGVVGYLWRRRSRPGI